MKICAELKHVRVGTFDIFAHRNATVFGLRRTNKSARASAPVSRQPMGQ